MTDLRQRLGELDQLDAPDMRASIHRRTRELRSAPQESLARSASQWWRGPLVAVGTAVTVIIVVAVSMLVLRATEPDLADQPAPVTQTTAPTTDLSTTVVSTTQAVPTTVPGPAGPASGEWVTFGVAAGLPGTPIETVSVDASGGVWALARGDDPTAAQLYGFDSRAGVFEARGEPVQLPVEWYTVWMKASPTGVVIALDQTEESRRGDLWQWDAAGWRDLSTEHNLPALSPSTAGWSDDGDLRVAGYTAEAGPAIVDIAAGGVTYSVAPTGAWGGGAPSAFTVGVAVIPIGPDGRSWFSDGPGSIGALGADGYEVYNADPETDCCYVPMTADESSVWASLGSSLFRYDLDGWRAETSTLPVGGDDAYAVIATADGDVWVLGQLGAVRFDPDEANGMSEGGWTVYSEDEAHAAGLPVGGFQSTVTREGDAVWVAAWSNGFSIWVHNGHQWGRVEVPKTINQEGTLFRQNTVAASDSGLWVSTSTGVARFDPTP